MRLFPSFMRRLVPAVLLGMAIAGSAYAAASAQRTFPTPDDATKALLEAVKANDEKGALSILGPGTDKWIHSGDPVADRALRDRFVAAYDQKHGIEQVNDKRALLTVGPDDWPFAFPLVKAGTAWRFDSEAGKRELLARRIGENELAAINVMLAIVDAQREYASQDRNRDGVREYARSFASTPGKRDGLYWQTASNEPPSPLGPLVAQASREGYSGKDGTKAFHGYYFRMLKGQGSHASGGALDYVVRNYMIGGFAAIAYPAEYGNSGVMTFIVNHDGVVYEKDLGRDTAKVAPTITRFDPGPGWSLVKPD